MKPTKTKFTKEYFQKKLKLLSLILISVPLLVIGISTWYTMFTIEPVGTILLSSVVGGAFLRLSLD